MSVGRVKYSTATSIRCLRCSGERAIKPYIFGILILASLKTDRFLPAIIVLAAPLVPARVAAELWFKTNDSRWIAISERDANCRGFAAFLLASRPEVAIHLTAGGCSMQFSLLAARSTHQ